MINHARHLAALSDTLNKRGLTFASIAVLEGAEALRDCENDLQTCKAGRDTQAKSYAALSHDHIELQVEHGQLLVKHERLLKAVRNVNAAVARLEGLTSE